MGFFSNRRRPDGSYTPPLLHRLVTPAISGNTVNGLGEREVRRPTPVYHHHAVPVAHRWMQNSFYWSFLGKPGYWKLMAENKRLDKLPFEPVAPERVEESPQSRARRIKEQVLAEGAKLVGIARMKPEWVFEGYEVAEPWIVVIGVTMDHGKLMRIVERGVDSIAGRHYIEVYNFGSRVARRTAGWLRRQGWHATGRCGPVAGAVNLIPPALQAGFGELGKHGSIINREFGSNFRIAYVLTEAPLVEDTPDRLGVDDFCASCRLCANHCPPDAIAEGKQRVRGADKWYVDFDRCVAYFNDSQACGICIAVCPWSRPGVAKSLTGKMLGRRARSEVD